jgi:hypothetical protein
MTGVQDMEFGVRQIAEIGLRALLGENLVVLAPDDQRWRPVTKADGPLPAQTADIAVRAFGKSDAGAIAVLPLEREPWGKPRTQRVSEALPSPRLSTLVLIQSH